MAARVLPAAPVVPIDPAWFPALRDTLSSIAEGSITFPGSAACERLVIDRDLARNQGPRVGWTLTEKGDAFFEEARAWLEWAWEHIDDLTPAQAEIVRREARRIG